MALRELRIWDTNINRFVNKGRKFLVEIFTKCSAFRLHTSENLIGNPITSNIMISPNVSIVIFSPLIFNNLTNFVLFYLRNGGVFNWDLSLKLFEACVMSKDIFDFDEMLSSFLELGPVCAY